MKNNGYVMDCVILCGGFGTRLKRLIPRLPKALAPINGFPFLELLLHQLESFQMISQVILATGYRADQIESYFAKKPPSFPLLYSRETSPLDTGGSLKKAMHLCRSKNILVLNGDCYANYALKSFYDQHKTTNAMITLICPYAEDSSRYGQVVLNKTTIVSFEEKGPHKGPGLINGGAYLMQKIVFEEKWPEVFSLEKTLFPKYINKGLHGYIHNGLFIDIGTPLSFVDAQNLLKHVGPAIKK